MCKVMCVTVGQRHLDQVGVRCTDLGVLGFPHFAITQVGVSRYSLIAFGPKAHVAACLPWPPRPQKELIRHSIALSVLV